MSTLVGATQQPPWGTTFQGRGFHAATGSRDVLIISQNETTCIQGEDIVPRRQTELTSDDKRELERLDLPPDQWQDASIMAARMNRDSDCAVTGVIKSMPGEPLTAKCVVKEIEIIMNNTQKEGGK